MPKSAVQKQAAADDEDMDPTVCFSIDFRYQSCVHILMLT